MPGMKFVHSFQSMRFSEWSKAWNLRYMAVVSTYRSAFGDNFCHPRGSGLPAERMPWDRSDSGIPWRRCVAPHGIEAPPAMWTPFRKKDARTRQDAGAKNTRAFYWQGKKRVLLKYIFLNSKLDTLDSFHNDGTVFTIASKKQSIKKVKEKI